VALDLTGQRFTRLRVLKFAGAWKGQRWWRCRCRCKKIKLASTSQLRHGLVKSCGCLFRTFKITHGATIGGYTHEYGCWRAAKYRCTSRSNGEYKRYGGAGIKFHRPWYDFQKFLADVGPAPSEQHSLDRWPDRFGDYEPGNVRWATATEQMNNRRDNVVLVVDGQTRTVRECALRYGVPHNTIRGRLRRGWPPEEAAKTPSDARFRRGSV